MRNKGSQVMSFSSSMPPGTKLKITADVIARNGFLLLTPSVVKVLGGHVDHMVEKWKASKVSDIFLRIQGYMGEFICWGRL